MAENGSDGEDTKYDADHSDLGEYEDVADVIKRTKQRLREQRAKQRADAQKVLEEEQQRRMIREENHQARLKRLEEYRRQSYKRIVVQAAAPKQEELGAASAASQRSRDSPGHSPRPPLEPESGRERRRRPRPPPKRKPESAREAARPPEPESARERRISPRPSEPDSARKRRIAPRPPEPESDGVRRRAPRARQMQMRLKRQAKVGSQNDAEVEKPREAEAASSEIESTAGPRERLESKANRRPVNEMKLAKARVAQRKKEEAERRQSLEEQQLKLKEEINNRNAIAKQVGRRIARKRLKAKQEQEHSEEERRAAWAEEQRQKRSEKAAEEAIFLPRVRAEAAKRGKEWLQMEKQVQEQERLEKISQQKAIQEKKQLYKNPKMIAKLKKHQGPPKWRSIADAKVQPAVAFTSAIATLRPEEINKGQALVADEVAQGIVGEAVISVSTDYCSTDQGEALLGDDALLGDEDVYQIEDLDHPAKADWSRASPRSVMPQPSEFLNQVPAQVYVASDTVLLTEVDASC